MYCICGMHQMETAENQSKATNTQGTKGTSNNEQIAKRIWLWESTEKRKQLSVWFIMKFLKLKDSPCSSGWGLRPVAFILSASLADMSQQEPLLVSWSLSAWSLSPCPLSLRLARSGSLNVELLQVRKTRRKRSNWLTRAWMHGFFFLSEEHLCAGEFKTNKAEKTVK